jgi:hypothetical protein
VSRPAALLACALAAGLLLAHPWAAGADTPDGGGATDGGHPPAQEERGKPEPKRERTDHAAPDPDAELIRHLEEIQQLELLQHLELFDEKAK